MDYASAQAHLNRATSRGIVPGLDSIRALLHFLGDPQRQLNFVHVAGTNGKGATAAMIASIARQSGILTGLYTSPAVFDDLEKYRVDGRPISPEQFAACMEEILRAEARMEANGLRLPTAFEIETALALLYFFHMNCKLVVLETGMGGLMDATNVVENTMVCVLTSIGLDHTKFLGNTLAEIAAQKSGIVKPGCAVVLEGQSEEVRSVVANACREQGAELTVTDPSRIRLRSADGNGQRFLYGETELFLPLTGAFQRENAIAAVEAARLLNRRGLPIPERAIADGLRSFQWPGRLERIHTSPDIYIDGAHNPNAARRLAEALPDILRGRPLVCVMGALADKDFGEVARLVCSQAACTYTLTPDNLRALNAAALAEAVRPYCPAQATESVASALECALATAGSDGVILAFGSLSYLGAFRAQVYEALD